MTLEPDTLEQIADSREFPRDTSLSIVAIIPLYNGAWCIEEAVRSVWAQTRQPDEFIVVDDGSTDDGPAIVERLSAERPITLLRKPNGGQSSARNHGVAHSTSQLIALLDQDDRWYPNHLEEMLKPFGRHRGLPLGWVYSDLDEIDEAGAMVRRSLLNSFPNEHPKRTLVGCLSQDMFILPSASLISREAFERIGGFDERLSGYEDDDMFLRMFRAGYDNLFLKRPLSQWRIYGGSTSYTERMNRSRTIYIQKLIDAYPDDIHRNHRYRLHCIAPRFYRCILGEYLRSFRARDRKQMRARVDDLRSLLPYLNRRRRLMLLMVLPLMRSYSLAYMFNRSPSFVRTAVVRIGTL